MRSEKKEVKKMLDDLYWKNDEIRKELIALHQLLEQSNYFVEGRVNTPPPQYNPPVNLSEQIVEPTIIVPPVEKVLPRIEQPQPIQQYSRPVQPPPQKPEPGFFERHPDLEKLIGERLLTFIGVAILVIGIAFFVKFAIDNDWINETGRTAIGILCGGIILSFAQRLRKNFATLSSVLVGGGMAVLYFTISYAFQVYHLFPQTVAFGLLVVITAFTVLLSIIYDKKELAIFAIVGGFGSPLMVATGSGNLPVLSTYMLILNIGMLVLAYYKKWNIINLLCYLFTIVLFGGAILKEFQQEGQPRYLTALLFATLFYFTFFLMNIINNLKLKNKFSATEIITLLSNTFLYYGCGYYILKSMDAQLYQGLFTLLVAVFNSVFAFLLLRRQEVDRNLFYFLVGLVITFVSLAGPVQLNGNHITLFWAAEGTLLFWLYQRSDIKLIRIFSAVITVLAVFGLLFNWLKVYVEANNSVPVMDILLNKGFVTGIIVVISFLVTALLIGKEKSEDEASVQTNVFYRNLLNVAAIVILFLTGIFEIYYQESFVRNCTGAESVIYLTAFTGLYTLGLWFVIKPAKFNFMETAILLSSVLLMVIYAAFPHYSIIHQRDEFLLLNGSKTSFMIHYVYTTAIILLSFLVYFRLRKKENAGKGFKDVYLWLMCFVLVFVASAELDHLVIISGFTAQVGANDSYSMYEEIKQLGSQSHKIGFPILWGISSFIMILIGMKKHIRQLRIIALVLFALTIIKLILLGVYGESQTGKIIAFIISGVILILVSFLYQKLKELVLVEDQPNEKTENHEKI
ncbi:DUF2339 domain-containing protein [soil metagenome]